MIFFEVIDKTNEMLHYPLGSFKTLDDAKNQILTFDKRLPISKHHYEDLEKIEIIKRKFGWSKEDTVNVVFTIEREHYYDEDADEKYWKIKKMDTDTWAICPKCKRDKKVEPLEQTLREDYVCSTTEFGDFVISYSCRCTQCNFKHDFEYFKTILRK